jgi:hypothetical protein
MTVSVLLVPRLIPCEVETSYKMLREFVGGSISSEGIGPRLRLIANEN